MTSPTLTSSLQKLTTAVAELSKIHPSPSLLSTNASGSDTELWDDATPSTRAHKAAVTDAAHELLALTNGPIASLQEIIMGFMDIVALRALLELGVFELIPAEAGCGGVHVDQLATKTGVPAEKLLRLLRAVAVDWVFRERVDEAEEGVFEHTALSVALRKDREPGFNALTLYFLDETYKGSAEVTEWLKETPDAEVSADSPIKRTLGVPLFQYLQTNPEKGTRFALGMKGAAKLQNLSNNLLPAWFRQAAPSTKRRHVLDLGGGNGHISAGLSQSFPDLTFTVLDAQPVPAAPHPDRVSFQQHDFFSPLPSDIDPSSVRAVFMRRCLHNWSDLEVVRILRNIVPLLKTDPEIRLLLNEAVKPPQGLLPKSVERSLNQLDICMMVVVNSKQRTEKKWRELVETVDVGLKIVKSENDEALGLLEIKYEV